MTWLCSPMRGSSTSIQVIILLCSQQDIHFQFSQAIYLLCGRHRQFMEPVSLMVGLEWLIYQRLYISIPCFFKRWTIFIWCISSKQNPKSRGFFKHLLFIFCYPSSGGWWQERETWYNSIETQVPIKTINGKPDVQTTCAIFVFALPSHVLAGFAIPHLLCPLVLMWQFVSTSWITSLNPSMMNINPTYLSALSYISVISVAQFAPQLSFSLVTHSCKELLTM